ncbi:MAG: hypothetical protein NTU79_13780 [Planctomycetota bacterium]|nr:hypothetical protein [Planctomycetota bacterium]
MKFQSEFTGHFRAFSDKRRKESVEIISKDGVVSKVRYALILYVAFVCVAPAVLAADEVDELGSIYRESRKLNLIYRWDFVHSSIVTTPALKMAGGNVREKIVASRKGVDLMLLKGVEGSEATGSMQSDAHRFNLRINKTQKWVGGPSELISTRSQRCFDGKIFGCLGRSLPGASFPQHTDKPDPNCPTVVDIGTSTQEKTNIDLDLAKSGMCVFSPHFPTPYFSDSSFMDFDEFIDVCSKEKSSEVKFWKEPSGYMRLEASPPNREKGMQGCRYSYWLMGDGKVEKVEVQASDGTVVQSFVVAYAGMFPTAVATMDWLNGRGTKTVIKNASVLAVASEKDFRVTIPDGAIVNDKDRRIQYTAGVSTEEEIKRLAEFVVKNKLSSVPARKSPTWLFYLLLLPLLAFVFYLFRRRFSRSFAVGFLLGSVLWVGNNACYGGDPVWDGRDWSVDLGASEQVRIRQCGFSASAIVLGILNPSFDPFLAAKLLEPTKDGVRMDKMKSLFEGYGIKVTAYKKSSLVKVVESLKSGEVAVIATSKLGINSLHYIVIASDDLGRKLFVDYPSEVSDFREWTEKDKSQIGECVALVCRKSIEALPRTASLKNSEVFLRQTDFKGGIYSGVVSVQNDGNKPIVCSEVVKSCSCVRLTNVDTRHVFLGPNSKVEIAYRLNYEDFARSSSGARIQFKLVNGQVLDFKAHVQDVAIPAGVGSTHLSRFRIEMDPQTLQQEFGGKVLVDLPWIKKLDVGKLRFRHPDWLRVELTDGVLYFEPCLDSSLRELLLHRGRTSCSVELIRAEDDIKMGEIECELIISDRKN